MGTWSSGGEALSCALSGVQSRSCPVDVAFSAVLGLLEVAVWWFVPKKYGGSLTVVKWKAAGEGGVVHLPGGSSFFFF